MRQGDTAPGQLLGTLAYMSPEQLRGGSPAPGWDVWALGVIAYEMLTGAHPFTPVVGRVADLDARRPTSIASRGVEHDRRLDAFFADALSPDPADRPPTASEWLARFEATTMSIPAESVPRVGS